MTERELRVGLGHDVHALVSGAKLVLGGVSIAAEVGFQTHSDGDVLCHALIDALAGAMADGDLGTHFPEDDPETATSRSLDFVREFAAHVDAQGYEIVNVDSFIVLGTVRIRPFITEMRALVADALAVSIDRVSIKARSNDGLGPEGEGRAAGAWASVLLRAPAWPAGDVGDHGQ